MATEDETPRGALACLHTGGAGTSCGRGAKGLSAYSQHEAAGKEGELGGLARLPADTSSISLGTTVSNRRQKGARPRIESPYVNQTLLRGLCEADKRRGSEQNQDKQAEGKRWVGVRLRTQRLG